MQHSELLMRAGWKCEQLSMRVLRDGWLQQFDKPETVPRWDGAEDMIALAGRDGKEMVGDVNSIDDFHNQPALLRQCQELVAWVGF